MSGLGIIGIQPDPLGLDEVFRSTLDYSPAVSASRWRNGTFESLGQDYGIAGQVFMCTSMSDSRVPQNPMVIIMFRITMVIRIFCCVPYFQTPPWIPWPQLMLTIGQNLHPWIHSGFMLSLGPCARWQTCWECVVLILKSGKVLFIYQHPFSCDDVFCPTCCWVVYQTTSQLS